MPEAPVLGPAGGRRELDELAFGARFQEGLVHQSVRAEQAARRRVAGHRVDQDPRDGLRGRRQAMAPEGHRTGSGRLEPGPHVDRRGRRLRAPSPFLYLQGQPQGAAGGLAQRPVPARASGAPLRSSTRAPSRSPRRARPANCSTVGARRGRPSWHWPQRRPMRPLSFRNLARVAVLAVENVGITDLLGAASCCSRPGLKRSQRAPLARVPRRSRRRPQRLHGGPRPKPPRKPDGPLAADHSTGRLREDLCALGRRQVHLPGPSRRSPDPDPPGHRGALRCPRDERPHDQRQV